MIFLHLLLFLQISTGEYLNFTANFEIAATFSDDCDGRCENEFYQNITNTACDGFYNCYAVIEGVKIKPKEIQEPPDIEIPECADKD